MISFIKRRKTAIIIAIVLIALAAVALRVRAKNGHESIVVSRGNLVRTVELSGKVIPTDDADLAFEVAGIVARSYKKVGDKVAPGEAIAELDRSSTNADLLKAEADLAAARAELAKLEGGSNLQAKISNSKADVVQDILDGYTNADDAVYNKVDQFFEDPRTANPKILFAFEGYDLRDRINQGRLVVGEALSRWKARSAYLSAATYAEKDLAEAKSDLKTISSFLDDVARAVNSFETNSALTQTTIDKYRTDVAAARQNVNDSLSALIAGEESLTANVSDVPVQAARVSAAEATVVNYQSKLSKMTLRSPISGVVSKQDAKVGEAVSANANIASVMSESLKIEAYVPEVSVAGVVVGAEASVTLDAYGKDVVFTAKVDHIDPRETVRDGVSTYKTELSLEGSDPRVRSGMTANITIETGRKEDSLVLPSRAITVKEGSRYVLVKTGDKTSEERVVETGIADTKGNVEIVSGLVEGESVLLNPVK